MIKLHGKLPQASWDADPFVVRISSLHAPSIESSMEALIVEDGVLPSDKKYKAYFAFGGDIFTSGDSSIVRLPAELNYLMPGDVVRIIPRAGQIVTLYRRSSPSNSILVTERCNSNCIMCSQPPKAVNDDFLIDAFLEAIPLMDKSTASLGITGGEPTLLGDRLFTLIEACKSHLPNTALHMLSNGRMFNYLSLAQRLAMIEHPDLMVGIPLYSDLAGLHDYVVQGKGAFDQTVRGIVNLKRCGTQVEVRVVLHRQTIDRLPMLARFLARNLPNVDHVALMGLEMMGYVKMNLPSLWIDPADYQGALGEAVRTLADAGINVSVYNHQLCVLDRQLWSFARKSISDWKNEYLGQCEKCAVRQDCGGFFASAKLRHSDRIRPVVAEDRVTTVS